MLLRFCVFVLYKVSILYEKMKIVFEKLRINVINYHYMCNKSNERPCAASRC